MKRAGRLQSALRMGVAEHVRRDTLMDVRDGTDTVDRLLHLAMSAVASFDGVGGGRQQGVVQEGQRFFQRGREEFFERLADGLEASDTPAEFGQLGPGGVGSAAAVEQGVNRVYDSSQDSQVRLPPRDALQRFSLRRSQVVLDEQMAVVEQIGDLGFEAFLAGRQFAVGRRRPAAAEFGQRGLQLSPHLCHGLQDGLVDVGDDVELADLVRNRSKDVGDGRGIQGRAIGRDAFDPSSTPWNCNSLCAQDLRVWRRLLALHRVL